MLKEFQDAAQTAERKERLHSFMAAIVGMILTCVIVLTSQYTSLFSSADSNLISSKNMTEQNSRIKLKIKIDIATVLVDLYPMLSLPIVKSG